MNQEDKAIFYLTTAGEYRLLSKPRTCRFVKRLRDVNRDDYMLVEIDPPLLGQSFGLGDTDVMSLLLSTRHKGYTLYPVKEWPTYVYVARITDSKVFESESFTLEQVELIAWGAVFNDLGKATNWARETEVELI